MKAGSWTFGFWNSKFPLPLNNFHAGLSMNQKPKTQTFKSNPVRRIMLIRQILSFVLILAFGLHLFAQLGIYVSFKINQDYIAEFLCIEKDIPESTCQGCCQLKDKLEDHEKQKQELPQSENRKYDIQLFPAKQDFLLTMQPRVKELNCAPSQIRGILPSKAIFHPPKPQA